MKTWVKILTISPLWIFLLLLLLHFIISFGFSVYSIVVAMGVIAYLSAITALLDDVEYKNDPEWQ